MPLFLNLIMSTSSANNISHAAQILHTATALRFALGHFSTMMACDFASLSQVAFLGVLSAMVCDSLSFISVWFFTQILLSF